MPETRPVKVHKVTLCIIDHDNLGPEEVCHVLENTRYPNHCMYPDAMAIETREVEWHDQHPLNLNGRVRTAFEELFGKTKPTFAEGERVRIVGGDHAGRTGTVMAQTFGGRTHICIDPEPGETKPTGGRNYCRGGRGGFVAQRDEFEWERA